VSWLDIVAAESAPRESTWESRLEPLKSDQVGFRWHHRQIQQAQLQLVLCRAELNIQKLFENHTIFVLLRTHITWMMDIIL